MKVAILTRTTTVNFGTVLQAYALQRYLKDQNIHVMTVDDTIPRKIYSGTQKPRKKLSLREKISNYIDTFRLKRKYAPTIKREKRFTTFKRKYIEYYYPRTLEELNNDFDMFIAGSDQIWAYAAEPILFPYYMLECISDDKVKASYGVSVGEKRWPEKYESKVTKLLEKFDYLSAREEGSQKVIEQYTEKDIEIVCDPVLLIDKSDWRKIAGRRKIKNRYVFCYFLGNNAWYYNKVEAYARKFGFEIFIYSKEEQEHSYNKIRACSPTDFLNYIEFAEFVITDSFHAFLFSMIFEKQFVLFQRFENGQANIQNHRLVDLLHLVGCRDRFLSKENDIEGGVIAYEAINKELTLLINKSKQYLNKILEEGKLRYEN